MPDQTEIQLQAAIAALRDVVAQAVDPDDPAAREQLQLVIDQLTFIRSRIGQLDERRRFEIRHHINLVGSLLTAAESVDPSLLVESTAALDQARVLLADPSARAEELVHAHERLGQVVVRILDTAADAARCDLDRLIVELSGARVTFERAWYAPLGFDPAPETLPSVEDLIAIDRLEGLPT